MSVYNTQVDGIPAYATSDLVEQHKSNPNLFKLIGRKDDQIMLSTGEKVIHAESIRKISDVVLIV